MIHWAKTWGRRQEQQLYGSSKTAATAAPPRRRRRRALPKGHCLPCQRSTDEKNTFEITLVYKLCCYCCLLKPLILIRFLNDSGDSFDLFWWYVNFCSLWIAEDNLNDRTQQQRSVVTIITVRTFPLIYLIKDKWGPEPLIFPRTLVNHCWLTFYSHFHICKSFFFQIQEGVTLLLWKTVTVFTHAPTK